MSFEDVFAHICRFIQSDPTAKYRLAIGTDSQTFHAHTRFITAIHLHRQGKGAWGALRNYTVPRCITSVREKISLETALSQEIAYLFTPEKTTQMIDILMPYAYRGADFQYEIHLDIGRNGITKDLINEMTGRIRAMGLEAKIKPDSYAASSYANRHTK